MRAVESLGTQDLPESLDPLIELAVLDATPLIRTTARESLGKLVGQRSSAIEQLRLQAEDGDRIASRNALEALAQMPLGEIPLQLRPRVVLTKLRMRSMWLLQQSLATPLRRATAFTIGIALILLVFAYVFSALSYFVDTRPSSIPGEQTSW